MIHVFFQESRVLGSIGSEALITCRTADFAFLLASSLLEKTAPKKIQLFYALVFRFMNISEMRQ